MEETTEEQFAEIAGPTVQLEHTPLAGFAVRPIKQNLTCGFCGLRFERGQPRKYVYPIQGDITLRIGKLACMTCYASAKGG